MDISGLHNGKLWNSNYCSLLFANVLVYIATYALIPVFYTDLQAIWGLGTGYATLISVLFILSIGLFGLINNYLVDTYPRKSVFILSVIGMISCTFCYTQVSTLWLLILLRLLHGGFWGISLMVGGSTLAIDVSPGDKRNYANFYFAISGILGTFLGFAVGALSLGDVFTSIGLDATHNFWWVSIGAYAIAIFLVYNIQLHFRAPLNVPVCSLDRFLHFKSLLPGINMMVYPIVIGIFIGSYLGLETFCFETITHSDVVLSIQQKLFAERYTFFFLALGYSILLWTKRFFFWKTKVHLHLAISTLLSILSLSGLYYFSVGGLHYFCATLLGFSIGFSISHFLKMMILLPEHCERGTGFHTFILLKEMGIAIGILAYTYLVEFSPSYLRVLRPYHYSIGLLIGSLLVYLFFTQPYFLRRCHK